MKSKVVAVLMTAFMTVGVMAGCGSQPAAEAPAETATEAPAETAAEAPAETASEAPAETASAEQTESADAGDDLLAGTEVMDEAEVASKEAPEESTDVEVSDVELTAEEIETLKGQDGMDKATAKEMGYDIAFEGYFPENDDYIYWLLSSSSDKGLMYIREPGGAYYRFMGKYENLPDGTGRQHSDDDNIDYVIKAFQSTTYDSREVFYMENSNGEYCWLYQVDPDAALNDFYGNTLSY